MVLKFWGPKAADKSSNRASFALSYRVFLRVHFLGLDLVYGACLLRNNANKRTKLQKNFAKQSVDISGGFRGGDGGDASPPPA